ncbi:SpoVR family protein [Roseibium aggregatum]|uniref:SpoVR family protein n=1 Tax=Roseibium aggregatum TaxID=187304 RepID=A0A939J3K2_9HYPH|nr:SpoVR family protein [Roseibium aggregatum]MBN9672583.1 SpoVR family protein [Roseibium aggregatum]
MADPAARSQGTLLFDQTDWDFDTLHRTYDAIEEVARTDLALDCYPNQVEIISSEQMLDAYSSIGMPLMYHHWSFGKHFLGHERLYRKGARGLAYEIVINSNPCISYCLEENTMPLQALVMAHAAFGHNHFFKSNHLFRQWTDADGILDYLDYARHFIAGCEEKHGTEEVEAILDAAHSLMSVGVFRHRRPRQLSLKEAEDQRLERLAAAEQNVYYLWNTLPHRREGTEETDAALQERKRRMQLPEENLLFFLEQFSPVLRSWQREILRIVRNVAQYFYPQKQTRVMNEGCACFVHYYILNKLYEDGRISDGAMLEILHSHTNVLTQPDFDDPRFGGINPYALGFAMMQDIRRICEAPQEEDREWFPDIAGCGDWRGVLKHAWANYRDESFIQQFLSPSVMRRFRMFALSDEAREPYCTVTGIHDARGYRKLREVLARNHDLSTMEPDIQVVDADLLGDRCLHLKAVRRDRVPLDAAGRDATIGHVERLWGYKVVLEEVDAAV